MIDETEDMRRLMVALINQGYSENEAERKAQLIEEYGEDNVWDTEQLRENFIVEGFMAPFTKVVRRSDNQKGLLMFSHSPRFYFDFTEV